MNRRQLFLAAMGSLVVKPANERPHTDFLYGDLETGVLSPDADPAPNEYVYRRMDCLPYLDGKPVRYIQRAHAVEGWMDQIDPKTEVITRLYGVVQILWATDERRAEFERLPL